MENNVSSILEGLNDEQRRAVEAVDGPVLIVAGAGSGKTRVLTSRIAYMLASGIDPSTILALTFTKKAATEMKERISLMVGSQKARRVVAGTFHAVFVRFLREYAAFLGYPEQFTIYDTSDSTAAIKACIKQLQLDDKVYKPKEVLSRISGAKNNLVTAGAYQSRRDLLEQDAHGKKPRICDLYAMYQQKLKESGVMDFDDILLNMNILLRDNPDALQALSSRFSYILVDEYQDTNFSQYIILKKLSYLRRNICVVGDDSQSIYAFRGAQVQNIINFTKDFPEARTYRLEANYRSTRNIVEAANSVIAHNSNRIPKECYSLSESGDKIRIITADTERGEAALVVGEIISRMREDRCNYEDFAILYRTNNQSRTIEEALRLRNIPYMIYSGNSFYERAEVKDMMAYMKLVVNPFDDESFKRIVNKPARGIGDTTIDALLHAAQDHKTCLFKACYLDDLERFGLKAAAIGKLRAFADMINKFSVEAVAGDAHDIAERLADESGMRPSLAADTSVEGMARAANLGELLDSVAIYVQERVAEAAENEEEVSMITLGDYLENVSLLANIDTDEGGDTNKVALMTVHSAKGLEFRHVLITGLEENLFPSLSMVASPADVEEERRLFYVALTRAKKDLVLTHATSRMRNGKTENNSLSRFVREIDLKYLENPGVVQMYAVGGSGFGSGFGSRFGSGSGGSAYGGSRFGSGSAGSAYGGSRFGADEGTGERRSDFRSKTGYGQSGAVRFEKRQPAFGSGSAFGGGSASRSGSSSGSGAASRSGAPVGSPRPASPSPAFGSGAPSRQSVMPQRPADPNFVAVPMEKLYVGERIEHNRFGFGKILSITGIAPELKAVVDFDDYGTKTLLLKFAKMRPAKSTSAT